MKSLYLCLLLTLAACPGFGQIFSPAKPGPPRALLLTIPQQRLRDSLLTLRLVRVQLGRERRAWRGASATYNAALDSLETAYSSSQGENRHLKEARVQDQLLLVSQTRKTAKYRARAHRKGVLNVLLSAAVAGLLYGIITK